MSTIFRDAVIRKSVINSLANGESGALELERALAAAFVDAFFLFQDRQKKYGPNNIAKRREAGVVVRADDKMTRLGKVYLERTGTDTPDETIEDTWIDLINYAAIGLLLHRGAWPQYEKPVAVEQENTAGWENDGGA